MEQACPAGASTSFSFALALQKSSANGTYAQVFCADCSREVEHEVHRLLDEIAKVATQFAPPETPVPLVDPA